MQISRIEYVSGSDIPTQDLLSYLSQLVMTLIDEEAKTKHKILEDWKNKIQSLKTEFLKERAILQKNSSELSRQKALGRVLSILVSLRKHGTLTGQNGRKISEVLKNIENKDFHSLRNLEERLGAYLPDR